MSASPAYVKGMPAAAISCRCRAQTPDATRRSLGNGLQKTAMRVFSDSFSRFIEAVVFAPPRLPHRAGQTFFGSRRRPASFVRFIAADPRPVVYRGLFPKMLIIIGGLVVLRPAGNYLDLLRRLCCFVLGPVGRLVVVVIAPAGCFFADLDPFARGRV